MFNMPEFFLPEIKIYNLIKPTHRTVLISFRRFIIAHILGLKCTK
jgi:hypothetical protein